MDFNFGTKVVSFMVIISLIALLAWLTASEEDPCVNPQLDLSGAVLADGEENQDALVNRAIVMKGQCDK